MVPDRPAKKMFDLSSYHGSQVWSRRWSEFGAHLLKTLWPRRQGSGRGVLVAESWQATPRRSTS